MEDFFGSESAFDVFQAKKPKPQVPTQPTEIPVKKFKSEDDLDESNPMLNLEKEAARYNDGMKGPDAMEIEPERAREEEEQKGQPEDTKYALPKIELEVTIENEGCIHETIAPKGYEYKTTARSAKPAREYKFKLDPFQRKAVESIEKGESVLVAAHTSAGKTAVAEYAIAMSLRDKQRVIYTSPIKALSNQKFRELNEIFGDVGLVTGDVTLGENASCLVMTTEILRSMLYRGSEIIREVAWVIFDEVHYMRDKERGVVWEETIILLSEKVKYVFLSATIPNAREFAEWICTIKRQPCHVVYTDYRPVPLQHYIFPSGGDGIYLVVDEQGNFKEDNFSKALQSLSDIEPTGGNRRKKKPTEGADLFKLIQLIMDRKFDPVIVFSFSKREVEALATAMNKFDFNTDEEKDRIEAIYLGAIDGLSEEDKKLPMITQMVPVLKRGIGIHHGGLLPIVKEIIEILFQDGLLKILFSTETFSMGLNMPARTVLFTQARKFDGENFRWIGGGEYIQMSGRAGRRGIDDKGITILMIDEKLEPDVAKGFLKGHSDPLNSSFHLSYNMLLNSMRIEDTDPEFIIRRSFHQFQNDKALPEMQKKLDELKAQHAALKLPVEDTLAEISKIDGQIKSINDKLAEIVCKPENLLPFLAIGRLVHVVNKGVDWGWGPTINFTKKKAAMKKNNKRKGENEESQSGEVYVVDIALHIKPRKKNEEPVPAPLDGEGEVEVVPILSDCIKEVSSLKIHLPRDLLKRENRLLIKETLKKGVAEFKGSFPLLDPMKDMNINDPKIDELVKKKKTLLELRAQLPIPKEVQPVLPSLLEQYENKTKIERSVRVLKGQIEECSKMVLQDDLKCMKRVLRRLNFTNKEDIVQLKGKVACEISACDEIIVTEFMFSGYLNEMEPNEIAAMLAALVHDEHGSDTRGIMIKNERLLKYFGLLMDTARKTLKVYHESKINIDEMEYLSNIRPELVEVAFAWCNGASFSDICKMTDIYEGSIIRCFRRLDELLKQLVDASKAVGNTELMTKFQNASAALKRGIIFAASLYL